MSRGPEGKPIRKLRCAVYTRKSTEEGLEQGVQLAARPARGLRGLHRQPALRGLGAGPRPLRRRRLLRRHAGAAGAEAAARRHRGGAGRRRRGLQDRPAVSRSLMDFSKLVEVFDRAGVTFVSVTQSFNTTTSMGRLTLNILLSFAQFEREVIAERIRDKIGASRQKGMWMGGNVPLGYEVEEPQAGRARARRRGRPQRCSSGSSGSARRRCWRGSCGPRACCTKRGKPIDKGYLYKLPEQPDLPRAGGAQGHRLSRRARGDHRPGPLGQGARDPRRERPHPLGAAPGRRRRRC